MFKQILVVCVGNVCRSPMAAGLLQYKLAEKGKDIVVDSAGLGALVGEAAMPEAQEICKRAGIDISAHRAKQLTVEMLFAADLILTMEYGHKQAIERMSPLVRGKVFLLGKWSDFEIYDPFQQSFGAFEHVWELILRGWQEWQEKIIK